RPFCSFYSPDPYYPDSQDQVILSPSSLENFEISLKNINKTKQIKWHDPKLKLNIRGLKNVTLLSNIIKDNQSLTSLVLGGNYIGAEVKKALTDKRIKFFP